MGQLRITIDAENWGDAILVLNSASKMQGNKPIMLASMLVNFAHEALHKSEPQFSTVFVDKEKKGLTMNPEGANMAAITVVYEDNTDYDTLHAKVNEDTSQHIDAEAILNNLRPGPRERLRNLVRAAQAYAEEVDRQ